MDTGPGSDVLLGDLTLDVVRGRPRLTLVVHCPGCRGEHVHGWGFDPLTPGEFPAVATHRWPHCWRASSPYLPPRGHGYHVAPADTPANQKLLERYAELVRDQAATV